MFILSKVVHFFVSPSNVAVLLLFLGLFFLISSMRRSALASLSAGMIILVIFGYLPTGSFILAPLENRFPVVDLQTAEAPHGIIVLGGSVGAGMPAARGTRIELNEAGERLAMTAVLARRFPDARLIMSGGDAAVLFPLDVREGDYMKRGLEDLGIDGNRIEVDRVSRNTEENAIETLRIIAEDRDKVWWLVTSAYHMPRSIGCFRRLGLDPVAFPVDFRTYPDVQIWPGRVVSDGLKRSDRAIHEWFGLLSYRLLDRTTAFFPGP